MKFSMDKWSLKGKTPRPEQEKIIRQRLFDISLRFVLKDAVYYYEHYKINIEDAFQSCSEARYRRSPG